jgi:hypothetical protein
MTPQRRHRLDSAIEASFDGVRETSSKPATRSRGEASGKNNFGDGSQYSKLIFVAETTAFFA